MTSSPRVLLFVAALMLGATALWLLALELGSQLEAVPGLTG